MSAIFDINDYQTQMQSEIYTYYDNHKYVSDEFINDLIDQYWDTIDPSEESLTFEHPGISGSLIIVEFNPDYDEYEDTTYNEDTDEGTNLPYFVTRVYENEDDEDRDYDQIDNGRLYEALNMSILMPAYSANSNNTRQF